MPRRIQRGPLPLSVKAPVVNENFHCKRTLHFKSDEQVVLAIAGKENVSVSRDGDLVSKCIQRGLRQVDQLLTSVRCISTLKYFL